MIVPCIDWMLLVDNQTRQTQHKKPIRGTTSSRTKVQRPYYYLDEKMNGGLEMQSVINYFVFAILDINYLMRKIIF